jgi:hypothetical protein
MIPGGRGELIGDVLPRSGKQAYIIFFMMYETTHGFRLGHRAEINNNSRLVNQVPEKTGESYAALKRDGFSIWV